jgi:hypothetical protein
MKTIKSRRVLVLGGILIASLAAGCYGGGHGYSNDPYGYNGGYGSSYSSNGGYYNSTPPAGYYYSNPNRYNGSYGNSYSNNNGYNGKSSYNAGYQNGVRADAANDRHQDRAADNRTVETQRTVATHDRASTEPSRVVHDDHSSRESRSTHQSDIN